MYTYKIAKIENLKEIIEVKNDVKQKIIEEGLQIWQNGYPQDELLEEDIIKGYGRIVVVEDEIVAYASYYPALYDYDEGTFPNDEVMSFGRIMTKVGHTKKGYCSFLVEQMIKETKEKKIPGMGILVDEFNKKALNIYIKHGFKRIGVGTFPWAVLDIYYLPFDNE